MCVSFSHVQLLGTPWTVALQVPLSMEFSRQDYWSGLPFPPLGDLPNPGIGPGSPALQAGSLPTELQGKPTMAEVMKIMATSFKRSHACTAILSAPNPAAGHHRPMPLLETPGHSQASLGQSLVGSLLLYPESWCTQVSVCALLCSPQDYFPVLCKF